MKRSDKSIINTYSSIIGFLSFFSFLLLYGITSRAKLQLTDEAAVLATSVSLSSQMDLTIDEYQWIQDSINIGQQGRGNHLYSKYFPGNVLSAALVYKITAREGDVPYIWQNREMAPSNTGARAALKINALFGALAMSTLFLLTNRYYDWKISLITVLLVGISSDWWYQSRGFLSEIGAGTFLIISLYFATSTKPYLSHLALATSILFRPTNLLAIPIWGLAVKRKTILSSLAIFFSLLFLAYYNWLRFASPFDFGYGNEDFSSNFFIGLLGILLSPGRSLFVYSPILILAIPGAWLFYKREKILTTACAITILGYIAIIATWHRWDGGWSWGSRLLTPILPILGFLIAPTIKYAWKRKNAMLIILFLAIAGISIQTLALTRDPLIVMDQVIQGNIPYQDTIFTIHNSWPAIQFKSLESWSICDLDAYSLKNLSSQCSQ